MWSDEPDLEIGGLSLWVLGWEYPDSFEYWDANWLNVLVRVAAPGAAVKAQGAFVHASEIAGFATQLAALNTTSAGEALLDCMEPNLHVKLRCEARGHVTLKVRITPEHLTQSHEFEFDLDQSYIGPLLNACEHLLSRWPVRFGSQPRSQTE